MNDMRKLMEIVSPLFERDGYAECPDCNGSGIDNVENACKTCDGSGHKLEESGIDDQYEDEAIARDLEEIREQIMELCQQALSLIPHTREYYGEYERARSYWYGHIMSACGSDEYPGGSATTMLDTVNELNQGKEDEY